MVCYFFEKIALFWDMNKFFYICFLITWIYSTPLKAQFSESKERKKMWRKSAHRKKNREAYNPYLDKKKKDKPSAVNAREDKKAIKKMRKEYKKQNKKNMKKLGIKPNK